MKEHFAAHGNNTQSKENELRAAVVKTSVKFSVLCQETALTSSVRIADLQCIIQKAVKFRVDATIKKLKNVVAPKYVPKGNIEYFVKNLTG